MEVQTAIGNLVISVSFPADLIQLSESLSAFRVFSTRPDYFFETLEAESLTVPKDAIFRRDHFFIEYCPFHFCLGNEFFSLRINFTQKRAVLTIISNFKDRNLLFFNAFKWFLSLITIDNGGIPLHCSTVFRQNKALIFSGKSGAGKSTILNILSQDKQSFQKGSDELNLIFLHDSTTFVFPTPYLSYEGNVSGNGAQIKHLFFLKKSPHNSIVCLSGKEKYWNVLKNIYTIPANESFAEKMYNNAQKVSNSVDCSDLFFINNQSISRFIEDWMDNGNV